MGREPLKGTRQEPETQVSKPLTPLPTHILTMPPSESAEHSFMSPSNPEFLNPLFSDVGILLVGHGTRSEAGQEQFRQLFKQFAAYTSPVRSELAFLELASPSISEAVDRISAEPNIRRMIVVPALLFTAGHALSDIPESVHDAIQNRSLNLIGQTESLECSPEVVRLSAIRFQEAVCPSQCSQGCCGEICSKTAWALVGRGSTSIPAADKMREFCRLRQELTPVRQSITAFIYGQSPSVPEAMDDLAQSDAELIVIQPHLLFSGLLLNDLRDQVRERQSGKPHQRWVLTEPLGADQRLAQLLAHMALDMLQAST